MPFRSGKADWLIGMVFLKVGAHLFGAPLNSIQKYINVSSNDRFGLNENSRE